MADAEEQAEKEGMRERNSGRCRKTYKLGVLAALRPASNFQAGTSSKGSE